MIKITSQAFVWVSVNATFEGYSFSKALQLYRPESGMVEAYPNLQHIGYFRRGRL